MPRLPSVPAAVRYPLSGFSTPIFIGGFGVDGMVVVAFGAGCVVGADVALGGAVVTAEAGGDGVLGTGLGAGWEVHPVTTSSATSSSPPTTVQNLLFITLM